ncbi:Protein CAJ1 [Spathaspora sp. JA1]|nr:Protein CAJ1 [Spathaspora sp. JA1]
MSQSDGENPIRIGYYDPFNIYSKIKPEFEKKLPLTSLHLKFHDSQSFKSIPSLDVSMFEEVPKKVEIGSSGSEFGFDNVYTRLMFIKIDSIDNYRSSVRPLIREWLKNIVFKSRSSWMIVLFFPENVKDTKSVIKVSKFDKLKTDFGVDGKELPVILPGNFPNYEGERCFKFKEIDNTSRSGVDPYPELIIEIKKLLLSSFTTRYGLFQDWSKQHKPHSIEGLISAFRISELLNDMTLYQESLDAIENVCVKLNVVVENNSSAFDYNVNLSQEFEDYNTFESSFADTYIRDRLFRKQDINLFQLNCLIFINYSSALQALSSSGSLSLSSIHITRLYQQIIVFLNDVSRKFPKVDLKEFQYSVIDYYLNIPRIKQLLETSISENDNENINSSLRNIYEFQAELKLFQRSILEKIAEERNYSISGLTKVLEDIPLDTSQKEEVSPPKKLINPKLNKFMVDKSSYFTAFTSITEEIIGDFVECDRSKSVDVLSIDLAILNYEKGDYKQCLEILQGSYDFFIANGWNYLGGILLEIYNGCIEKLNLEGGKYNDEILTTCLKLSTCLVNTSNQIGINSYGLIKDKSQIDKLFSKINEYSLKQFTPVKHSLDELFESRLYFSLFGDTSTPRDQYYIELEINNPFQRAFNFKFVEASMMSNEGFEIIFRQDNVEISDEPKHILKLYSNTFKMGLFKLSKLTISMNEKLLLASDYFQKEKIHNDGTVFNDRVVVQASATPKEPWYKRSLQTFPDLDKFRCHITCPNKIQLGVSEVLLNIYNGDNQVKNVKIKMFSSTEGLRITEANYNIENLDAKEVQKIVIPYTYSSDSKLINIKGRITYQVEDTSYVHEISYDLDTSLTISVTVSDFFKQDFIYSKFQVGVSNPNFPIRVIKNQLTTKNDNYSIATSKINLPELVAFGEQPASIFFRITPKENYRVTNEDTVDLTVWYSNLQEECETRLFNQAIKQLRAHNLIRYWFMLKDLLFSKADFDLNKYAITEAIEIDNQAELNDLTEKILSEYVEPVTDREELLSLVRDVLTSKDFDSTTRNVLELNISVSIPIKKYLQIVEYQFDRKSQYVVGEPIKATLKIDTVNKWSADEPQDKSVHPDEFQALVQNDDNWVISGYKKRSFTNGDSLTTDLLLIPLNVGVNPTANDVELKKAYRKQAIKLHPDKNANDPKAAEKFQELGEAYGILQNPETRKIYDEFGVEGMKENAAAKEAADVDPAEFFTMIFGGEAFNDWIGELSMLSEISKTAEVLDEKEEEDKKDTTTVSTDQTVATTNNADCSVSSTAPAESQTELTSDAMKKARKKKMSKEQREEVLKLYEESKIAKQKRVDELAQKLLSRVESYQSASNNPEALKQFTSKLRTEFEDLKIESFGIQLLHLIGKIYTDKANATIRSNKTLGVSKIFSSVKNKTETIKNGFNILSTAMDAQQSVEGMLEQQEQLAAKKALGYEVSQEELYEQAEMERILTGKFLATAWASTKFEVTDILAKVCSKIFQDKEISKKEKLSRANAVLYIGKELSQVQRSPEEEEDARIFEEMMAEAQAKKSKKKKSRKLSEKELEEYMRRMASSPEDSSISNMANSKQVLGLYKQLLEKAYKFDNYNFREYSKRRIHDSFKANKTLTDPKAVDEFYNKGIDSLALLHRQTSISQMYTFDKLVVEPLKKHH